MRQVRWVILLAACGGAAEPAEPAVPAPAPPTSPAGGLERAAPASAASAPAPAPRCAAGVPAAACAAPGLRPCEPRAADRAGEWRYALIAGPFEPTLDVPLDQVTAAWRAGTIAATAETAAALAGVLGAPGAGAPRGPAPRAQPEAGRWAIVPAHELGPAWSVITVDGKHPLEGDGGPLALALCGAAPSPVHNIDPAHVTRLVMSGVTAMTGRTAERIDATGVEDTIRHIRPFFRGADLVHISNEVSFVRTCDPSTGQDKLVFCSRDRYIEVLEALGARLIELTGSHLLDYGDRALVRTIDQYAQRGWIWFGGGRTQIDATTPRLIEDHGNRLAFVGCNAVAGWIYAISPGPGVAHCHWARMVWQIQDLRRRGFIPIATVQHREPRTHPPPPDIVTDLRRLAEAGAAFVMGSQAHVAHPWDVHHGAAVHYGPGNILFAQYRELQRDAAVDKLYLHEGRLLTIARLYTRSDRGQPRLQTDAERARFLGELATAAGQIAPPAPDAVVTLPPETRERPDSLVIRGRGQRLIVTVPERTEPGVRYPLVVDLAGTAAPPAAAYLALRTHKPIATGEEIAAFMRAKYPIDPAHVDIVPAPAPPKPARSRKPARRP